MVYRSQFDPECIPFTQVNIIYNTRLFWRKLAYWTRTYFNSEFLSIGNAQETFERLYRTPEEFSIMLQFVVGRPIAERFLALFNEYIVLLRQLIMAVLNGDAEGINESVSAINRNSEERAKFLAGVFPSLDQATLKYLFDTYSNYEIEVLNAYISRDFSRIIEISDNRTRHANAMADYLATGIIDLLAYKPAPAGTMAFRKGFKNQELGSCITYDELNTSLDIAMFWVELVEWLRIYRISKMAGVGNPERAYRRLIQVTVDFGNRLKTLLDAETVDAFILLIQEYIHLLDQLLEALMANNTEEVDRIYSLIMNNINARTGFLASVFPSLNESQWRDQLDRLNTNIIDMATAFLTGDYSRNIQIFDYIESQAEDLGAYFTQSLFDFLNE